MTAVALDDGRSGNLQRQSALLHHIYAVLEWAAQVAAHEVQWCWPAERSAVAAYLKERMALETSRKSMGASPTSAAETNASVAASIKKEVQAELDGRTAKGSKGKGARKVGQDVG